MIQHLSMFTQASSHWMGSNLWLLIGIAVAACVLGIQVACISILIRKVKQAKIEKLAREEEERRESYRAPMLLAAASVPFSAELVLAILLGLSAVASVVFLVLLIAVRSKGYDFSVQGASRAETSAFKESSAEPVA
ncbi:MAG: hypothetical protein E7620_07065, partial [Ruminococcaceae bacterium]|nr:hypothetical protein [Oscillospiraceae bacterium]